MVPRCFACRSMSTHVDVVAVVTCPLMCWLHMVIVYGQDGQLDQCVLLLGLVADCKELVTLEL